MSEMDANCIETLQSLFPKSFTSRANKSSRLSVRSFAQRLARKAGNERVKGVKLFGVDNDWGYRWVAKRQFAKPLRAPIKAKRGKRVEHDKHVKRAKHSTKKAPKVSEKLEMLGCESAVGRTPDFMVCLFDNSGQLCFLVKWANTNKCDLVEYETAKRLWPQLVIRFYEQRLVFTE